jgi:hypothetical protein
MPLSSKTTPSLKELAERAKAIKEANKAKGSEAVDYGQLTIDALNKTTKEDDKK